MTKYNKKGVIILGEGFKENFDLYPLSLNMSEQQFFYNKEKSFEDLKPLNLEDMCQIFLDIVQKRCDVFKQNENLDWDTAQNRQSLFQKFFNILSILFEILLNSYSSFSYIS